MDVKQLIAQLQSQLQAANGQNVTINVNINQPSVADTADDLDFLSPVEDDTPDTDFEVDDRVLVCHIRHDGTRVHTMGTVIEVLGQDDKGWYTRVLGDNGKHYRTGLTYNEERLGSMIIQLEEDMD